jgi:hypothetical protein
MSDPAPRTIILVSGIEFPRYKKEQTSSPQWWKANSLKRIRNAKSPGALSFGACRPPAEVGLKYDGDVLVGSDWRLRALRVAVQRLSKDPALNVLLFDIDRGTEERVLLQNKTLSAVQQRKFSEPLDADYRLSVTSGTTTILKALDPKISIKTMDHQPAVRFYPFVSEINTGPVDHQEWLDKRAKNTTWLEQYEKRPDSSRLLSVLDVYKRIQQIGRDAPYTLQEFQLWGHASSSAYSSNNGTAFANTDHVDVVGRAGRHPLDLDARAIRDFDKVTIDRRLFRMAFAKGAMTIVWGCNWSRPFYDVLGQAIKQLGTKPLKDDASFVFSWRQDTGGPEGWFRVLMDLKAGDPTKNVKKDGKFLRELVQRLLRETYMQQLANLASRCVTGGVPGVGSDYDERSEQKQPCLSNIPLAPLYGMTDNMQHVLNFYVQHFGVRFNPDGAHPTFGRGFALYCPDL